MPNPDLVTLVTENDEVIGSMDKIEAHRGAGKLHRASSVFLFRKNNKNELELLIQKRSDKKIVGAGQWANTVCGNVLPEESYEDCARRRLNFELGIAEVENLEDGSTFRYHAQCNEEFSENEIVHIFAGWFDGEVKLNKDEVAEIKWVEWESIAAQQITIAPWFKLFLNDPKVKSSLENYVGI